MPQEIRTRRQGSMTLNTFGQKVVLQLGRGMIYRELMLNLSGSLTYAAGANNAAATLGRGDEWSIIQRIDVIANGTDVIRSFSGTQLRQLQRLFFGSVPRPSLTLGDGATAAPTFDSTCIIPFWQPLSSRPMDTAFDSSKVSDLRLEITVDNSANINTANGPTAVAANMTVASLESFGVQGAFSDCRIFPIVQASPGANNTFQVALPVSALYRGFFINAANGSANNSTDLPAAITNIQIKSGPTVFRDMPFGMLRDWQRQRLGWGRDVTQLTAGTINLANANGPYLRMAKSALLDEDAWTFLDLVHDGFLAEGIDALGYSELIMEFNLGAASTISVLPVQIFPQRGK